MCYSGYQLQAPLNDFSYLERKIRWTSTKHFRDDTPVLFREVEFVMETFD